MEVPIPTRVLLPPFAKIALGLRVLVVVAHLELRLAPDESSASHPNFPAAQVKTLLELQVARSDPKKLVVEAVVAKKLVVVADVPVALVKVRFWRVVEEVARRFLSEVRPALST